jgi:hypothetical protein
MSVQLWLDVRHEELSTIRPRGADTGTTPYPLCGLLMSCEIRHAGQVQQRSKNASCAMRSMKREETEREDRDE